MKTNLSSDLALLKTNIKEAYEESIRSNCTAVKDLLFECVLILSKISSPDGTPKTKKHKWSQDDELVGFFLASKYSDTSSFRGDNITKRLLKARPTISIGSLQMLIQNFYHLMKKDKGLGSASKLAKEIHKRYRNQPLSKLHNLAEDALKNLENTNR
jgi:hypothetical protein